MKPIRYWILVAAKNHVLHALQQGVAQACHGKAAPLRRMQQGDGIIYYSARLEYQKPILCQEFTAIGTVCGNETYLYDMGNGFTPFRRDIHYMQATACAIQPLIAQLQFIKDKKHWGYSFRFGIFTISQADFQLIATAMQAS